MPKKKIAVLSICLNAPYWEYIGRMIESAKNHLLKGHEVDFLIFTDIPEVGSPELTALLSQHPSQSEVPKLLSTAIIENFNKEFEKVNQGAGLELFPLQQKLQELFFDASLTLTKEKLQGSVEALRKQVRSEHIFHTEPVGWPYPTLMRYNLYLRQEEVLKEYDYLFHCDADMLFVNTVGDEILGPDLTMAQHPMYSLRRNFIPPLEPNPESSSFVPRLGRHMQDAETKKVWFEPLYAAGGFQGGTSEAFIKAMKTMKRMIDQDMAKNYIPIWNDESVWNRYLFDNQPSTVLNQEYVFPDSLIEEYYKKIWEPNKTYTPRIVTITKRFSLSKKAGDETRAVLEQM